VSLLKNDALRLDPRPKPGDSSVGELSVCACVAIVVAH
jgi:hypothetical protein